MANDTIGSMTAVIRATAAQFSNDMKQAESSIREFSTKATENFAAASHSVDSFREHLGSISEGLGIGAGIELMRTGIEKAAEQFHKFFEVIESGAQLEATAKRIGTTAASLSELQYAAERSEVSAEQLTTGLEKMEKTIGEVHAGNKEAAEAFNALHLSVSQIENLTADEQFFKIADAIRELKNPADEAAEAMKIFGKAGADLLPLIDQGSEAMKKMMQAGRDLGRTVTDEDAHALELANQSIKDLKEDFEALTLHLTVQFVPLIRAAAKMIDNFVVSIDKQKGSILDSVLGWTELIAEIGAAVAIAPAVISAVGAIAEAFEGLSVAEAFAEALNPATLAALGLGLAAAGAAAIVIHDKFNDIKLGIAGAVEEAKKLSQAAESEVAATKQATKARNDALAIYEEQKKAAEELVKLQERLQKSGEEMTKSLRTPMERYIDAIKDAKALLDAAAISAETFRRASAKAAEELIKAQQQGQESSYDGRFAVLTGTAAYEQAAKNDAASKKDEMLAEAKKARQNQDNMLQLMQQWMGPAGNVQVPGFTLNEANF